MPEIADRELDPLHWDTALSAAIEVSIAIAGFSGIVAAVGHRSDGRWNANDQLRLQVLLTASGAAGTFAFLPFVLLDAALDPKLVWRIGSGAQFVWIVGVATFRIRQANQMGAVFFDIVSSRILAPVQLVMLSLLAMNTVWLGASWPYLAGVLGQLAVAFFAFVRLLLGAWSNPHNENGDRNG